VSSALAAFVHHVAAFTLFAALVVELVLIREELTFRTARRLQVADLMFGLSAAVVLAVGALRVVYLEKGAAYYFHNVAFIAKISLFVVVALLSIYPTVTFLSWRPVMREGRLPAVDLGKVRRVRAILHWELIGALLVILCAALMARGIGS
jgi:putative membrane protein